MVSVRVSLLLLGCLCLAFAENPNVSHVARHEDTLESDLITLVNFFNRFSQVALNQLSLDGRAYIVVAKRLLSPQCYESWSQIARGLTTGRQWAAMMMSSTGKFPTFYRHVVGNLGDYDECLQVQSVTETTADHAFRGKYCLLTLDFDPTRRHQVVDINKSPLKGSIFDEFMEIYSFLPNSKTYTGLCIPSTCHAEEVHSVIQLVMKDIPLKSQLGPKCDVDESMATRIRNAKLYEKVILVIVGIFVTSVVVATILHPFFKSSSFVKIFSARCNTLALVKMSSDESNQKLFFIHYVKVVITLFVIILHVPCFGFDANSSQIKNPRPFHALLPSFTPVYFSGGMLNFLVFFTGAIILVASVAPELKKRGVSLKLYFLIAFGRWMRVAPLIAATIAVFMIFPLFGSGPIFNYNIEYWMSKCRSSWSMSIIGYSNSQNVFDMCLIPTWFLNTDLQVHLILIALIMVFARNFALGLRLTAVSSLVTYVVSFVVISRIEGSVYQLRNIRSLGDTALWAITPIYNHFSYSLAGMLFGFWHLDGAKLTHFQSILVKKALRPACVVYVAFFMFLPMANLVFDGTITGVWIAMFIVSHNITQPLCLLVIYTNMYLAEIKPKAHVLPLSRLALSLALVNFPVTYYYLFVQRTPIELRVFSTVTYGIANVVLCIVAAYLMFIVFEAPITNFLKYLMAKSHKQTSTNGKSE